jgi:nucleotide-binding universal stress UspA family protein
MILLTVDASPASEAALPTAIELARRFDQPLRVLLILDGPLRHHFDELARDRGADTHTVVEDYLQSLTRAARQVNLDLEAVHRHAIDAGPAIVEAAEEPGVVLLVMATHGRSGLSRLLAGSVTAYVIQHSPVPTVVVPAERTDTA